VVPSQGEYDWTVQMQAPEKEGKYCAYFRLTFGDNIRFGHKIWCQILVKKPKVEETMSLNVSRLIEEEIKPAMNVQPKVEPKPFLIQDDDDDLYEVLPDKAGSAQIEEEVKEPAKLSMSNVFQSPKEVYFNTVMKETDEKLRAALITLYEFGFVEYKINKTLLQKYKNDANMVCEILLNGALNESTFQKIFTE